MNQLVLREGPEPIPGWLKTTIIAAILLLSAGIVAIGIALAEASHTSANLSKQQSTSNQKINDLSAQITASAKQRNAQFATLNGQVTKLQQENTAQRAEIQTLINQLIAAGITPRVTNPSLFSDPGVTNESAPVVIAAGGPSSSPTARSGTTTPPRPVSKPTTPVTRPTPPVVATTPPPTFVNPITGLLNDLGNLVGGVASGLLPTN